jgi:hypothetical protein
MLPDRAREVDIEKERKRVTIVGEKERANGIDTA